MKQCQWIAGNALQTADLYPHVLETLHLTPDKYNLASLRYHVSKLRAKNLISKIAKSRRYRLLPEGYSICLVFLKLFDRIYTPLTAGLLQPVSGDSKLQRQKRTQLDRLYNKIVDDLDQLIDRRWPQGGLIVNP